MLKFVQGRGNIVGHGEIDCAIFVIPVQCETAIEAAGPVRGDGVQIFEGCDQMPCVFIANVFDAELVNNKGEGDGARFVEPQSRG
jgi:hypothetical protein